MKRCIVILLLLLQCLHSGNSYSAQDTYTIDGLVLEDGTDRPLPHVRVVMDTLTNAAYTDEQGHFSLLGSVPGRFRLVPTLEGYVYARPNRLSEPRDPGVWIQIAPGEHLQNIRIEYDARWSRYWSGAGSKRTGDPCSKCNRWTYAISL